MKRFFKSNLAFILGILALMVAFVVALKHLWKSIPDMITTFYGETDKVEPNPIKLDQSGSFLTENQADLVVTRLYEAMRIIGTNDTEIFYQLNGLGNDEFNHVYNKFGRRYYNKFKGTDSTDKIGDLLDLIEWLRQELSSSKFDVVRRKFNAVF